MSNITHSLLPLTVVAKTALDWYNSQCEPHSGDFGTAEATVLLALALGMPEVLQGDADGACFVVKLEGGACPEGMAGTTGLCTLWVTENLELTIIPVAGTGAPFAITPEQLVSEYAVVCVNHHLEGWVA